METNVKMVIIPLDEYNSLVDFRKSIKKEMYFERILSGDFCPIHEFWYFRDEESKELFKKYRSDIANLKSDLGQTKNDLRKCIESRRFRKEIRKKLRHGN